MYYLAIFLYSLSLIAQLAAATLSVSLIKQAKNYRLGWLFLGIASSLMLGRRISPILFAINTGDFNITDAALSVPISMCLFLGIFHLKKLLSETELLKNRFSEIAKIDFLTSALSRLEVFERAQLEIARSIRTNHPLALLSLDIDHFKQINDRLGHHVGDEVLKGMVAFFKAKLRANDFIGRTGGEEFLIVLPETNEIEAMEVAERLREGLSHFCCHHVGDNQIKITVSIGIAVISLERKTDDYSKILQMYLDEADEAMYCAKKNGRNRCKLFKSNKKTDLV